MPQTWTWRWRNRLSTARTSAASVAPSGTVADSEGAISDSARLGVPQFLTPVGLGPARLPPLQQFYPQAIRTDNEGDPQVWLQLEWLDGKLDPALFEDPGRFVQVPNRQAKVVDARQVHPVIGGHLPGRRPPQKDRYAGQSTSEAGVPETIRRRRSFPPRPSTNQRSDAGRSVQNT